MSWWDTADELEGETEPAIEDNMAEIMAGAMDSLQQCEELARGFREHLAANDWSPTIAEQLAANYLNTLILKAMGAPTE